MTLHITHQIKSAAGSLPKPSRMSQTYMEISIDRDSYQHHLIKKKKNHFVGEAIENKYK